VNCEMKFSFVTSLYLNNPSLSLSLSISHNKKL